MEVEMRELNVDGMIDERGIRFIGTAKKGGDGRWTCLADVCGCLCVVEVTVRPIANK